MLKRTTAGAIMLVAVLFLGSPAMTQSSQPAEDADMLWTEPFPGFYVCHDICFVAPCCSVVISPT